MFELTEEKALLFHRALIGLLRDHPNLIPRARDTLMTSREKNPAQETVWDRWEALLDMPLDGMAGHILADTPDGGLLRAHSPFSKTLLAQERNAVWQRIGLMQFIGHFHAAADGLGLTVEEQAVLTGLQASELTGWKAVPPSTMETATLQHLKTVVSLHKAMTRIEANADVHRRWLRGMSETLGATPISLLLGGEMERVLDSLSGAVQLTMGPGDLPRMG
ncbi:MAG: hypothetical protein ISR51_07285 [Rhodospirillales bacterium]|nr:hypothetical protein [Alphaproteobacteria bacterium]MBL6948465.1 hypothetical protein [Rhodospirillales bacterium]